MYKQHILIEVEAAAAIPGGVGALLRREGLYSSLLTYWRRERADGIREALTPRKRRPKSKRNPMEEEVQNFASRTPVSPEMYARHTSSSTSKKSGCAVGEPLPETDRDPEEKS
jgi:hypothetical protein